MSRTLPRLCLAFFLCAVSGSGLSQEKDWNLPNWTKAKREILAKYSMLIRAAKQRDAKTAGKVVALRKKAVERNRQLRAWAILSQPYIVSYEKYYSEFSTQVLGYRIVVVFKRPNGSKLKVQDGWTVSEETDWMVQAAGNYPNWVEPQQKPFPNPKPDYRF